MKVLITGGAGFLGRRLASKLLQRGVLRNAAGVEESIDRLVLFDAIQADGFTDPRVCVVTGDIADPQAINDVVDADTASIFHLAAVVSSQAEADFDLGMRVNIDAMRLLFERCRQLGHCPKVLFASSVAVYGGQLPELVRDDTALNPKSSYGIQKAIGELLLSDYSRKGFIDGRGVRLPTISVRPGKPNKAASSFASGIIREPLSNEATICPVTVDTRLWLLSPRQAIECLVWAHDLPADAFAQCPVLNLPGVSVTVCEMVDTLGRVAGKHAVDRIRWESDPVVQRIVGSWPGRWDMTRAHALGFKGDADFEGIVRAYVADDLAHTELK
ncbi:D-erythronate dehydrogenase [Propionivibrio sp.]|uniref:D-erythronate dehydrogenase n=1 Tax=Propionivibrio sp. TaxID=2212460 RepID=UPI0025F87665|nr:D-erythronate dehydrogenase [Propionivibrio sp.]MBK7356933.1 SDR family oxidoreductase [Propionivibrio sp.]MBK8401636.1 SDR family oxidoreductase [Propionivibrio sp.]MBK8745202.1 SDR family oxidoreductase [Propionivibrio sp.]